MRTTAPDRLQARAHRGTRKRQQKKDQIASSAMQALQELGYANTSLRDIAARADLSLGTLHYYFEDRVQLILHCVSLYKAAFISGLEDALREAIGREPVINALANALATSIVEDAATHRLWYDIRGQALFDPAFRPIVDELEAALIAVVETVAEMTGRAQPGTGAFCYALIDGVFRYQMQNQLTGTPRDHHSLAAEMRALLERLF
ncbi:MAG: TetR/AcrR family transcriptional regulator [Spiribacter salinus]|uniref:TetR/AcrR family transcriptional regulator n=1 Tax=Spiribacter salinus TaxID=1335746 RepID=A0A540VRP1_9GAMM|nr:MAG: TetR/AcrR family transcriptional regulator [Spiribacter salinus]